MWGISCTASRIGEKDLNQSNEERRSEFSMHPIINILQIASDNVNTPVAIERERFATADGL
jgi:hypothetical protein